MTATTRGVRLSPEDALMLQFETTGASFHTLKIAILDTRHRGRPVTLEELARWVPRYVDVTPRMTQRVVRRSYWHWYWVDDPDFNVHDHLEETTVEGHDGLDDLCGRLAGGHLDRSRPLWRITLVHGLEEGRQAAVLQVHHAIMDGSAAMNAFTAVTSAERGVQPPLPVRATPTEEPRGSFPARTLALLKAGAHSRRQTRDFAPDHTLPRTLLPKTRFNPRPDDELVCGSRPVPAADISELAGLLESGINGVVHAVLALALRTYMLEAGDEPTHPIVMTYGVVADPTSPRTDGNKLATARLWMHVEDPDPLSLARRTAHSAHRSVELRRHRGFAFQQQANDYAWLIPLVVAPAFDLSPYTPVHMQSAYVSGAKTTRWFGDVEATGFLSHAVSVTPANTTITAYRYAESIWIGVHSARAALPDPKVFMDHVAQAVDTLLTQARDRTSFPASEQPLG